MTEADINKALEVIFKNKDLKSKLDLDKDKVYNLRHRNSIEQKLKVLFDAGALKLK